MLALETAAAEFPQGNKLLEAAKQLWSCWQLCIHQQAAAVPEGWIRAHETTAVAMDEGPSCSQFARRRASPSLLLHLCSSLTPRRTEMRWPETISTSVSDQQVLSSPLQVSLWCCWRQRQLTHGCNGRALKCSLGCQL